MEPHRQKHRVAVSPPRRQAGMTALGMLILAGVFGVIGLGALKVTPLYLQNMRVSTVMDDLKAELDGKGTTAGNLRLYLNKRLYVEGIDIGPENVKITPVNGGYSLRIQHDNRARYIADTWLLVAFDKQIEIRR